MKQALRGIYVIIWIIFEVILKASVMSILERLHIGSREWHRKHALSTLKGLKNALLYAYNGTQIPDWQRENLDSIDAKINLLDRK